MPQENSESLEFSDPYTYPGSSVLRNLLDLHDKDELLAAEYELTLYRRRELLEKPIRGKFDLKRLQETHRRLFQDVYEWAGKIRTVEISKGGSQFHARSLINVAADSTFTWLQTTDLLSGKRVPDQAFIEQASDLLERVNYIHPFREGNGRTQRAFLDQIADLSGRSLAWRNVSQVDHLRASIEAFDQASSVPFHDVLSRVTRPPLDGLSLLDEGLYRASASITGTTENLPMSRGLAERRRKFPELFNADQPGADPKEPQTDTGPER
jgi:cell filamentation protein